jgi:hypothetical protein
LKLYVQNFIETEMKAKKEQEEFKLTSQGSLGILALGSVGIRKWREVAKENKVSKKSKPKKDE